MNISKLTKFLFILILLLSTSCGKLNYKIVIPKSDIQAAVDQKFPFRKNAIVAMVFIGSPKVYFQNNKIGIHLKYMANFLDKEAEGFADVNGKVSYVKESGTFYLKDFHIVDASYNGKKLSSKENIHQLISDIVKEKLNYLPLYKLDQGDYKQNIAQFFLKDVYFRGDNLYLILGI